VSWVGPSSRTECHNVDHKAEVANKLCKHIESTYGRESEQCLVFPTYKIALRCRDFLKKYASVAGVPVRIVQLSTPNVSSDSSYPRCRISAVFFPGSEFGVAKSYWQHTGEGVSSRMAEYFLARLNSPTNSPKVPNGSSGSSNPPPKPPATKQSYQDHHRRRSSSTSIDLPSSDFTNEQEGKEEESRFVEERFGRNLDLSFAPEAKMALRRRIAGKIIEGSAQASHGKVDALSDEDVYLYPTGMTSIFQAHQILLRARADQGSLKTVCFGFPYIDTLKILQKFGPGAHFFGIGETEDLVKLEALLESGEKILALFCEFASNPLLKSPDLKNLRRLADKYDFAIVVDETVGNFLNIHVLPYADIVVSSLTKVFSGDSNVMGGSLVLNPHRKYFYKLKEALSVLYEDYFWSEDAIYLERNSRDFAERNVKINKNAVSVVNLLSDSPLIKTTYYPMVSPTKVHYDACRVEGGGYGGLLSVVFHSPEQAKVFFDTIHTAKGPSLGTNFTLTSPYAVLAHYNELDYVESFGVDRNLIRMSVGLEDPDQLKKVLHEALLEAERAGP
jgi:cystathionine gamma-synthase